MDHGIDITNRYFLTWTVGVPVIYFSFVILFRILGYWNYPTRRGSRASDIMAFQIVAGGCCLYLAAAGIIGYFSLFGVSAYEVLVKDQWYGRSSFIENHLLYPMISYQGWNFLLSCVNKDLGEYTMLAHHLVTGMLAYFSLFPYIQYQTFFFSGIVELSNIPLTIMDIFKYFPKMAEENAFLNSISRTSFGISFIILRLMIWPVLSYSFQKGSYELIVTGKAHSNMIVGFFMFANLLLTSLQFYWGMKIIQSLFVKKVSKTNSGGKKTGKSMD